MKSETGLSVNEFINEIKVGVAKNVLKTTNNSILSISDYLGYNSQSHFVKTFKKITGVTPSEFRKDN